MRMFNLSPKAKTFVAVFILMATSLQAAPLVQSISILVDLAKSRVWVRAEGLECDDIDDTICDFFDEDYVLEKYQDFGITERQYELLMRLHGKLRKFTDTYGVYSSEKSTEKLIALPQW